jgi:hypothetical protein
MDVRYPHTSSQDFRLDRHCKACERHTLRFRHLFHNVSNAIEVKGSTFLRSARQWSQACSDLMRRLATLILVEAGDVSEGRLRSEPSFLLAMARTFHRRLCNKSSMNG